MKNSNIHWVIQSNLISEDDLKKLRTVFSSNMLEHTEVQIIPFSDQLPEFDTTKCNIYYGSITFNNLVYQNPMTRKGVFFDPVTFSIENYFNKWGKHMLNYGAAVTTLDEFTESSNEDDRLFFIRPDEDNKSFAGEIKKFGEIKEWYQALKQVANSNLSGGTKIIVSHPYEIKYEWRLWIVKKKVIAATRYRQSFQLSKEKGCPDEVKAFAEDRCKEYVPHDVFVMDVCLCGNQYYILECGCMNGAGFYEADINQIILAVTDYFSDVCNEPLPQAR